MDSAGSLGTQAVGLSSALSVVVAGAFFACTAHRETVVFKGLCVSQPETETLRDSGLVGVPAGGTGCPRLRLSPRA